VVVEKATDGKESLKITIKAPTLRGEARAKIVEESARLPESSQPVTDLVRGAPNATGQIGPSYRSDQSSDSCTIENLQAKESREGKVEVR
jgi:hypothetical protein